VLKAKDLRNQGYQAKEIKEMIEKMGTKWCCHPDNRIKRLDVPLLILNEPKTKVLRKR
jgi:hypothetical protein